MNHQKLLYFVQVQWCTLRFPADDQSNVWATRPEVTSGSAVFPALNHDLVWHEHWKVLPSSSRPPTVHQISSIIALISQQIGQTHAHAFNHEFLWVQLNADQIPRFEKGDAVEPPAVVCGVQHEGADGRLPALHTQLQTPRDFVLVLDLTAVDVPDVRPRALHVDHFVQQFHAVGLLGVLGMIREASSRIQVQIIELYLNDVFWLLRKITESTD